MMDGTGAPLQLGPPRGARGDIVRSLAFSPGGRLLASADAGSILLWRLADPGRSFVLRTGSSAPVSSLAFDSEDGILAAGDGEGPVQLWDVADPARARKVSTVPGDPSDGAAVAFSPDGDTLASADADGYVRLWNTSDPSRPRPAGRRWQASGTLIGGISSLAFSPHGHLLATGADNGAVRLWNVADPAHSVAFGQPLDDAIGSYAVVAFSADGAMLAIAGNNDSVQLWDVTDPAGPRPIGQPLTVKADPAMTVSAGPGTLAPLALAGASVVTGSTDGDTRLWDTDVNHAIKRICAVPGDELTPAQWHRYIPQLPYTATCPR
jgi:WD40 repeat protein